MQKKKIIFIASIFVIISMSVIISKLRYSKKMVYNVSNINDVTNLFPKNPEQIKKYRQKCTLDIETHLKKILDVPSEDRNFDNTVKAIDKFNYFYNPIECSLRALELLSPDKEIRKTAQKEALELSNFLIDKVLTNVQLFKLFKDYVETNMPKEQLSDKEKYLVNEIMKDFKRYGLDLPEEKLKKVRELTKEIKEISFQFETNINEAHCGIEVTLQDLDGLDKDFIDLLQKSGDAENRIKQLKKHQQKQLQNSISQSRNRQVRSSKR